MQNDIDKQTYSLFNRVYGSDDTEEYKFILKKVEQQISDFGWEKTFESWQNFLFKECHTPESVINFANLFWCYRGDEHKIKDPYKFLGYFYFVINFDVETYDDLGILDSIAITILPKAGYKYADRMINCDYIPELDPKIKAEVKAFKSQQNKNSD